MHGAGRRRPGEFLMWIAQNIGIEGFVNVTFATCEAQITFSSVLGRLQTAAKMRISPAIIS